MIYYLFCLSQERSSRLIIICAAYSWSPTTLFVPNTLLQLKRRGEINFATVYAVKADLDRPRCEELGITAGPAILFYWDGKLLTVRRPDFDDDNKCMFLFRVFGLRFTLLINSCWIYFRRKCKSSPSTNQSHV